jgi:hypothetical protein
MAFPIDGSGPCHSPQRARRPRVYGRRRPGTTNHQRHRQSRGSRQAPLFVKHSAEVLVYGRRPTRKSQCLACPLGVRANIQRTVLKRRNLGIQVRGHLADLRARQRLHPQLLGQRSIRRVETPSRYAVVHHRNQGLLGAAPMRQQPVRENEPPRSLGTASPPCPPGYPTPATGSRCAD